MTIQQQMRKGTTTVIILKLLADADRPMYGYEIIQELEARSGGAFDFKEGLIYPRLHELERQGLLSSHWQGDEGGRRRKFYTVTETGRRRLEWELQSWRTLTEQVNRLLGVEANP